MIGECVLCGYTGEISYASEQPNMQICLMCFLRFYGEKQDNDTTNNNINITDEENNMAWSDVDGKGGKKDQDTIKIAPDTTRLMYVLLQDSEEPVSYWAHYIPNKTANGPKGKVVICPGKDVCPACAANIYQTKRTHAINVWDYESKAVKIFEGGNSIFQVIKQIKDQIGTLSSVNMSIKRIGKGKDTQYSVVPIPMMSPFDHSQVKTKYDIEKLRMPNTVAEVQRAIDEMNGGVVTRTDVPPTTTNSGHVDSMQTDATWPEEKQQQQQQQPQGEPILQFGKYKGRTVADVYKEDPNYIKWCSENISDIKIKNEAKRVIHEATQGEPSAPKPANIPSEADTTKQIIINTINKLFQEDERYKGNYPIIIEKMRLASTSTTHPKGKTIIGEYTLDELKKLLEIVQ